MYTILKLIHLSAAILSFAGFLLRSYWMMSESEMLRRSWVRILPHIIDTVFLLAGIGLIVILRLQLMANFWLLIKFAALLVYIILGMIALRRGRSRRTRISAFIFAVLTYAYIVGVALSKSAASWVTYLSL
jgi:uncharacterized membrane protein SirB2